MALHDWTGAHDSAWHNFHQAWLVFMAGALNRGVLPEGFLARAEEYVGPYEADVLAVDLSSSESRRASEVDRADVCPEPTLTIVPPQQACAATPSNRRFFGSRPSPFA